MTRSFLGHFLTFCQNPEIRLKVVFQVFLTWILGQMQVQKWPDLVGFVFFQKSVFSDFGSPRVPDFWDWENLIRTWSGIFNSRKSNFFDFRELDFSKIPRVSDFPPKNAFKRTLFGDLVGTKNPQWSRVFGISQKLSSLVGFWGKYSIFGEKLSRLRQNSILELCWVFGPKIGFSGV